MSVGTWSPKAPISLSPCIVPTLSLPLPTHRKATQTYLCVGHAKAPHVCGHLKPKGPHLPQPSPTLSHPLPHPHIRATWTYLCVGHAKAPHVCGHLKPKGPHLSQSLHGVVLHLLQCVILLGRRWFPAVRTGKKTIILLNVSLYGIVEYIWKRSHLYIIYLFWKYNNSWINFMIKFFYLLFHSHVTISIFEKKYYLSVLGYMYRELIVLFVFF